MKPTKFCEFTPNFSIKDNTMKALFSKILVVALMFFGAFAAQAQTYPFSNPTYIPNMRVPTVAVASGVANTTQVTNGLGTLGVQVDGTCTSLNGRLEGTVNGSTWVTMNLYPYNAISSASAVTSVTGTGVWFANGAGVNSVRFNNSAVSGTACTETLSGNAGAFALPR